MKKLTRLQMKNVFGGMTTTKKCTMDCTTEGNSYSNFLGTVCTTSADCSSSSNCESGYTKTYHCS